MPTPRFAVITVTRDALPGLIATHRSLAVQTWPGLMWIVIDGGSRDGTVPWLAGGPARCVLWRSAPDDGPYAAMNDGLEAALSAAAGGPGAADYVLFLNAGDRLAGPTVLARIAAAIEAAGWPSLVFGDTLEPVGAGVLRYKPARSPRRAWYGMFTHHQAIVYRARALAGLRFDPRYRLAADYGITLAVLARAGPAVGLGFAVAAMAPAGLSARDPRAGRREQRRIRARALGHGLLTGAAITGVQIAAAMLRRCLPILWRRLRCRPLAADRGRVTTVPRLPPRLGLEMLLQSKRLALLKSLAARL